MNALLFNLPLMLLPTSEATGAAGTAGGGSNLLVMLVTFALIIGVFYFLVIRPQNKKQKDAKAMLSNLHKGDRVVTIGGLRGTIVAVKEETVLLKVDDTTKLEYSKSAISTVLERTEQTPEPVKE